MPAAFTRRIWSRSGRLNPRPGDDAARVRRPGGYRRAQVRVVPVQAYPAFFLALGFAGCFSAASFAAPLPIIGNSISR